MKITLYREKILSPCKMIWDIWNKMGRKKLQFVFKPLKIHSTPFLQFSLSGWVESPCLFLPYRIPSKIVLSIPVIFYSPFSVWSQLGYCWQFLCWQASQERLWVADSCWNKSLALWGKKEIHSTFLVSLFPSSLTSFFLLYSYHNNSLVHWMQTVGIFSIYSPTTYCKIQLYVGKPSIFHSQSSMACLETWCFHERELISKCRTKESVAPHPFNTTET